MNAKDLDKILDQVRGEKSILKTNMLQMESVDPFGDEYNDMYTEYQELSTLYDKIRADIGRIWWGLASYRR